MAAALCLMARDRQGPKIDLQVLINPVTDLTGSGTLERQNDALDVIRWQALQYVSDPKDASNGYVSPFVASNLSHLPDAVVLLAEKDDLKEDGQRYAERLRSAGVPTFIYCQKNMGHLAGHGARASFQARESLDIAVDALKKSFLNDQAK
jgi:acetyl esterase